MNTAALSVILPRIQETIDMPPSMHPEDRAFLIRELGKISSVLAVSEERVKQLEARLEKLEDSADATGQHQLVSLQNEIIKRDQVAAVWKGRVWSIAAVVLTSAFVGLITHWLATH